MSPSELQSRPASTGSRRAADPALVGALRVLVAGGGTIALIFQHMIDPTYGLLALVAIAIPSHIGAVLELAGRLLPKRKD